MRQATQRIEDLPGVVRACASYNLPLDGAFGIPFNIAGRTTTNGRYDGRGWLTISPGYFDIFKIPVLRGRVFTDRDDIGADRVAIINQTMARKYRPGYPLEGDPIGSRIILGKGYGPEFEEPAREIIGVVGDVHEFGVNVPQPVVYVPIAQVTDGITALMTHASSLAWIVRTRTEPHSLTSSVEKELQQITGGVAITRVRSMDEIVVKSTASASFQMTLLTTFGVAALLLAAVGIYGLMAYSVQQRTQEIGIRLALGAESSRVRNMLVLQGVRWAILGIPVGVAAAFALSRLMVGLLFGVKSWDPLTFLTVPVLLILVILFAAWLPSRRATRIDPVAALRHE